MSAAKARYRAYRSYYRLCYKAQALGIVTDLRTVAQIRADVRAGLEPRT